MVAIPPAPTLPDGPLPVFDDRDMSWLATLIAFRDRAIANDMPEPGATPLPSSMDPAMKALATGMLAAQRQMAKAAKRKAEKLRAKSEKLFGVDGRGFLEGLNNGKLVPDFWQNLRALLFQRISILEYHAPDEQEILRDLAAALPAPGLGAADGAGLQTSHRAQGIRETAGTDGPLPFIRFC